MTAPSACPACGAALRPGAPWCTLCYADLRPKAPAPVPRLTVDATLAPTGAGLATWPCTSCGTANSFERDTCATCAVGFLAAARDDAPLLELPLVGDLTRLGRGQRLGLAAGVVLAFLALVVIIGLLFG